MEVFPLTDDAREEVPRPPYRRLVLVSHGQFTASESGEDSFLPVAGQMDDEGDINEPTRSVVGESDTESLNGGASSASAAEEVLDIPEPDMAFEDVRVHSREIRDAFASLDAADLEVVFSRRAVLMKTVPHFLRGAFRNAMRLAVEEATHAQAGQHERGWKLFVLLPRMLLHRPSRGGNIPKNKLVSRFDDFSAGRWDVLIRAEVCDRAAVVRTRKRRHQRSEVMSRGGLRDLFRRFRWGELSSGRQTLEGADLA